MIFNALENNLQSDIACWNFSRETIDFFLFKPSMHYNVNILLYIDFAL